MLPYHLSLTMYPAELGYNGEAGPCRRCQRVTQLRGGVCRACRQADERKRRRQNTRRPVLGYVRLCPDCGRELSGHQRRCAPCSRFRHDEQRRVSKRRRGR